MRGYERKVSVAMDRRVLALRKLAIPFMNRFCKFQRAKAELASASARGKFPLAKAWPSGHVPKIVLWLYVC